MYEWLAWVCLCLGIIALLCGAVGTIHPALATKKGDVPPSRRELLAGTAVACALLFTLAGLCHSKGKKRELWDWDNHATPLAIEAEKVLSKVCVGLAAGAHNQQLIDVTSGGQRTVGVVKGPEFPKKGSKELSVFGIRNVINVNVAFRQGKKIDADSKDNVCTFTVANRGVDVDPPVCRSLCGQSDVDSKQRELIPLPADGTFAIDDNQVFPETNESLRDLRVR
jgi:hypothetical protein